ncbi:hypothetical protein DWV16_18715 [Anaerotruncus sp. AF02-27]|uniref:DUF6273 domain-containing protein n=1 Tax=Anaerotruncus sp. AF02-27 TaxID=2292191 RepID=UPI000E4906D4|nr:DUF6273 domain-containing protein [Anaerotruncus sp. AF02-27]RGX50844.1 hypothetical protein DWV16_18715 [Anaerotruncus sp. AF02-27]
MIYGEERGAGGISTKTIPPQGLNLTLKGGNGKIDCTFTGITSEWLYLGQYYRLIAKPGSAPTSPMDGVQVKDVQVGAIGDAVISASIEGLTNGVQYYVRLYVRGDNGWQTSVDAVGTATPVAGIALGDLALGTLLQLGKTAQASTLFEVLEFDHSGYPIDSCVVITKYLWYDQEWDAPHGTHSAPIWGKSNCRNWLNSAYLKMLSASTQNELQLVTVKSVYDTSNDYVFIPSIAELGGTGSDGVPFNKFINDESRIMGHPSGVKTRYITRTAFYSNGYYPVKAVNYRGYFDSGQNIIWGTSVSSPPQNTDYGLPFVFSLNRNMLFNPEPNPDGSYSPLT